jgi:D-alanyl-D-alanine dipeptidase
LKSVLHSLFLLLVLSACIEKTSTTDLHAVTKTDSKNTVTNPARDSSVYEKQFVKIGLVNIREMDNDIRVVMMYNSPTNFLGKSFYKGLDQCYLNCEAATKLNNAQKLLKQRFPFYNLIVFDAARPAHIQKMMWDSLKLHPVVKYDYLARPDELSLHNYGAAVDVSIINENGVLLDMGTPYDFFGELAQPKLETELYASGKLSKAALCNRLLLRKTMLQCGFYPITSEWWHFNACNKFYAAANHVLIP